jgi:hypothetical protein
MTVLLQLAVALVMELGLDKHPRNLPERQRTLLDDAAASLAIPPDPKYHNSDERRAFAGCFYLNSV